MIPQLDSEIFGQLLIMTTFEVLLILSSAFIALYFLIGYSDISWATTFSHLPSSIKRILSVYFPYSVLLLLYDVQVVRIHSSFSLPVRT